MACFLAMRDCSAMTLAVEDLSSKVSKEIRSVGQDLPEDAICRCSYMARTVVYVVCTASQRNCPFVPLFTLDSGSFEDWPISVIKMGFFL